jgi:hypothetical protein
MMGGVFSKEKRIRKKTVKGIVPPYSTVRDKKSLGKRGANQNSISVGIGEKKAYARWGITNLCM